MFKQIEQLRVVVCGYSQADYPRDETIMTALNRLPLKRLYDLRVTDDRWIRRHSGLKDKRGRMYRLAIRLSWTEWKIKSLFLARQVDLILVLKWNEAFVLDICRLAKRYRIPVVYDLWVSRYLTAQRDQKDVEHRRNTEKMIIHQCDHLLALTEPYRRFYVETFKCSEEKISVAPLAVEDVWINQPISCGPSTTDKLVIAYWGNVHKQHGIEVIREAAHLLSGRPEIQFRLYGSIKLKDTYQNFSTLQNVTFFDFMPRRLDLMKAVDDADICLGHLVPIHDSHLVLPNKALEGMARAKVVLHINNNLLHPLYMWPDSSNSSVMFFNNSIKGLVEAILKLHKSIGLRKAIGNNARKKVILDHSIAKVQNSLLTSFESLIN